MSANLPRQELAKRHVVGIEKPFALAELLERIEQMLVSWTR
jgi:hypothetical protein